MTDLEPIPLIIRTRLAHATLQAIADECGADILHIKGAAVDPSLLPEREDAPPDATSEQRAIPRLSADADVLVRPSALKKYQAELQKYGWICKKKFRRGGSEEHSADYWHDELGWADIHRSFPGMYTDAEQSFELLWEQRLVRIISHYPCTGPNLDSQRLIMLLHASRNGDRQRHAELQTAWFQAGESDRERVHLLSRDVRAEVPLELVTGHTSALTHRPEYTLWLLLTQGSQNAFELWKARLKAAPTLRRRVQVLTNPLQPKLDVLAIDLGRTPTAKEALIFYRQRTIQHVAALRPSQRSDQRRERRRS